MTRRNITRVAVTYEDGTTEVIDTPEGFHRTTINYDKGARHPEEGWTQHEIRWSERS